MTYRSLLRSKGTFFINLAGLSTAMACSLLIYLWINDELAFDKFHEKDARLFQVMENVRNSNGIATRDAMPIGMAQLLLATMPEVEYAATVTPMAWFPKFILQDAGMRIKKEAKFVGKNFFNIFSYGLLAGDRDHVLARRYSIVISEALAKTLFGSADAAVGKTLPWELAHFKKECIVSGVFEDVPANSSEQFDLLLPIDLLGQMMGFNEEELGPPGPKAYVVLKDGADLTAFNKKLSTLMSAQTGVPRADFFGVKYSSEYLYGKFENGKQVGTRVQYVKLLAFIALIILFIACINFMNLVTAKASARMKEIGIKKAIGAGRKMLILQYLAESVMMSLISLITGLGIATLLLPQFNEVTGKRLFFDLSTGAIGTYAAIALVTGVVAGSYPALFLSGFKPVTVLKGQLRGSWAELLTRKGLVVFQFTISIVAMLAVFVIDKQMAYVQSRNLGYDRDNLIYFELEGKAAVDYQTFFSEVRRIPGVVNASGMVGNIIGSMGHAEEVDFANKKVLFHWLPVDYEMIETLGIELEAGRTFSRQFNDSARVIFNRAAIDALEIDEPLGKVVNFGGEMVEIIGITKNFHVQSFHEKITPMAFRLETKMLGNIFVRIAKGKDKEVLSGLQAMYRKVNPGYSLDYRFADEKYQSQYLAENRVASLSRWFAALTVVVACLGLFGLAAFSAERRTKEIGIRKVLGSSTIGIAYLLCRDFVALVIFAMVPAWALSYYLLKEWLEGFAYSINLEFWFFLLAGFLAITSALIVTGSQAARAALISPAKCLRSE
ncbi:MAG TPA: ABC transporter permease [Chryseosolibacter sp.]